MIIYQEENNFWAEFTQLVVKSWVYQKCRILAEKPTILWQTKLTNTPLWGSDENVCISNVCVGWYFFSNAGQEGLQRSEITSYFFENAIKLDKQIVSFFRLGHQSDHPDGDG